MKAREKDFARMTSIARRINFGNVWTLAAAYIGIDILAAVVFAVVFVIGIDWQMLGEASVQYSLHYIRSISCENGLRDAVYTVRGLDGVLLYELPIAQLGGWLSLLWHGALVVVIIEGIKLFSAACKGAKRVRKALKPLDEIAARARELSNLAVDEAKYHNLEDAISNLKVDAMENGIHMHDKELHGIETALNGLLERIRASYRQQAQFVSDASHELRTPIAVIQGYVNMLDRWGKEDEAVLAEAIGAIQNEADHMQRLVEQLLFLARGDSNRQSMDMKPQDLNALIREAYEESLMIDEGHIYRFEELGSARVYGDYAMLKQSARILIDNAAKYTKEGEEIILRAGIWEDGSPFYAVQDSGIGMSQEALSHAFDRFYRADEVRNSKTGGTGLGLSIAKWIVERHGGYYEVVSREGLGTRFCVIFPKSEKTQREM